MIDTGKLIGLEARPAFQASEEPGVVIYAYLDRGDLIAGVVWPDGHISEQAADTLIAVTHKEMKDE